MKTRFFAVVGVAAIALGATIAQAGAPPTVTSADVFSLSDGTTVEGASSTMLRTDGGATISLSTSGLPTGHAITMWLLIFNNPAGCITPYECTLGDLIVFGGSGAADDSIIWGAGRVIGREGTANYAGRLNVGNLNRPSGPDNLQYLYGPGLSNPRGAHVLFVVHDHGIAQPGILDQQIHSFDVGCPGGVGLACPDPQGSYNAPTP